MVDFVSGGGEQVVMLSKGLFVVGLLLIGLCSFWASWTSNSASLASSKADALRNQAKWEVGAEPTRPSGPPSPTSFEEAFYERENVDAEGESEVPSSELKWTEEQQKVHSEMVLAYETGPRKDYAAEQYEWLKSNWAERHEVADQIQEYELKAEQLRNSSTPGTLGFLLRWVAILLMGLGLSGVLLKGDPAERAAALATLGLGLPWMLRLI